MTHKSWHWPDHIIRKRESRRLREEHNALYNSFHELLGAMEKLKALGDDGVVMRHETGKPTYSLTNEVSKLAGNAIKKAKGEA